MNQEYNQPEFPQLAESISLADFLDEASNIPAKGTVFEGAYRPSFKNDFLLTSFDADFIDPTASPLTAQVPRQRVLGSPSGNARGQYNSTYELIQIDAIQYQRNEVPIQQLFRMPDEESEY